MYVTVNIDVYDDFGNYVETIVENVYFELEETKKYITVELTESGLSMLVEVTTTHLMNESEDGDVAVEGEEIDVPQEIKEWAETGNPPTEEEGWVEPANPEQNYHNPDTGESARDDLDHPEPIGPHIDYKPSKKDKWIRIFPDGSSKSK